MIEEQLNSVELMDRQLETQEVDINDCSSQASLEYWREIKCQNLYHVCPEKVHVGDQVNAMAEIEIVMDYCSLSWWKAPKLV